MNLCIYCFKKLKEKNKTKDHLFPKSWYPEDTLLDLERWTVPACYKCNQKYGTIEDDLLLRIGICIDPNENSAKGISEKAKNKFFYLSEIDKRKAGRKDKNFEKIIKNLKKYVPNKTLKGMTPKADVRSEMAITIPNKYLLALGKKIITGLEHICRQKLINKGRITEIFYVYAEDNLENSYTKWSKLLNQNKININLGPAFKVEYGVDPKNENTAIYHITIWNHFELWGWAYKPRLKRKILLIYYKLKRYLRYKLNLSEGKPNDKDFNLG